MRLHLTADQYSTLQEYLFGVPERVAFLFLCNVLGDMALGDHQHVDKVWLLDPNDYLHRDWHGVELGDHVRPTLIRTAHQNGNAVVEVHAHDWPGPSTRFSQTDLDGLQSLGPHMTWRLPGHPYTALVLGPDSFDALQWHPDGRVTAIDAVVVDGEHMAPTGLSIGHLNSISSRSPR